MEGFFDTLIVALCLMSSGWVMRMMYEMQRDKEGDNNNEV